MLEVFKKQAARHIQGFLAMRYNRTPEETEAETAAADPWNSGNPE